MAAGDFFFTPWVLLLITRECHDEFFVSFNFFHVPCLKLLISKVLGYGIIAGSVMVKVPQILKVVKAGNTQGLSILSFYAELLAFTVSNAYNVEKGFPFSTWGESLFMSVQTSILIIMCYYYSGSLAGALAFPVGYSLLIYVLISGLTSEDLLTKMQVGVIPILFLSKFLQIYENFRNGHTGQLSGIMVFMLFAGALARVFTTYQETGDMILLANFIISLFLNGVLLFQIIYYWNKHPDVKVKKMK